MRRPLLIALVVGVLGIAAAVVGGILVSQALARDAALAQYRAAASELRDALAESGPVLTEADEVLALAADPMLPATELGALAERRETAAATVADAEDALETDVETLETDAVQDEGDELRSLTESLAADADLAEDVDAVLTTVLAAAPGVETANFDADNAPRIAFRTATDDLGTAAAGEAGESLGAYLDAAHALAASHAEELAEKAGPLFEARMAAQAFARSLAGGVLLEFDWATVVNGYGTGGSYGGTSYWSTADGGQATVTLSDSVAAQWPGAGVQALVAHEVGHAILARGDCNVLFFESDLYAGEEESWATAWAIGLGYTADGSGESVYGRPSDALIALAQQCR